MKNGINQQQEFTFKFKVLGFYDDVCECMICGKEELKGTFALENTETGEIIRAGSTCGAKMANWTKKELTSKLAIAEKENYAKARTEFLGSDECKYFYDCVKFLNMQKGLSIAERSAILEPFKVECERKLSEVASKYSIQWAYKIR